MKEGGAERAVRIEEEEEGVIGSIHPEIQPPKILEGEERQRALSRLDVLDREIERLEEDVRIMRYGGLHSGSHSLAKPERKSEEGVSFLRRDLINTFRHIQGKPLLEKQKIEIEELSDEEKRNIQEGIDLTDKRIDALLLEKADLQGSLYTPDELKRMHDELEDPLGRRLVYSRPGEVVAESEKEKEVGSPGIKTLSQLGLKTLRYLRDEETGTTKGIELDEYLEKEGLLDRCLSNDDEEVQNWIKHPETYPEELKGVSPFLWKSKRETINGWVVAYLDWSFNRVQVNWRSLKRRWSDKDPVILSSKTENLPTHESIQGVELFLHPKQKDGWIEGFELEKYLKKEGFYERTLSLEDDVVKGWLEHPETYPEELEKVHLFLWKSQRDTGRDRSVAYLLWDGGRVFVDWRWLKHGWSGRSPVLLKNY